MVGMDSSFLLALWFPDVPCSIPGAKESIELLVKELDARKERILIPTPALSEILVRAGTAGPEFIARITKSSQFEIAPFDILAAYEAALSIASLTTGKKRGNARSETWAKIKFDHQIVAICKVRDVRTLYSDDRRLRTFAESRRIATFGLKNIPLAQPTLFSGLDS